VLDVLEGIASLTDKSLLRQEVGPDGEPRYGMLETVREFGLTQLAESGEEPALRRAHAAWFTAFAEQLWDGIEPRFERAWTARVAADRDNFRAALTRLDHVGDGEGLVRLTGSLWWMWHMQSQRHEARRWLERALDVACNLEVPSLVRARALHGAGVLARNQGDYARAFALASECLERSLQVGDQRGAALGHALFGQTALAQGDYERAALHEEQALVLFEAVGAPWSADGSRMELGAAALGRGDLDQAAAAFESTLARNRSIGNAFGLAYALGFLGLIACRQGDLQRAAERFAESLPLWQSVGNRENLAEWLAAVATLAAAAKAQEQGARLYGAAEGLRDELGHAFSLPERSLHEAAAQSVRIALGEPRFGTAYAAGRALPFNGALEEASHVLGGLLASHSTAAVARATENALTPREVEVLRLVAAGHSNREIAAALFISIPTVKRHLTNILGKLDLPSRSALNTYAHTHGLV
jgi:DNA-binding CsgD family transcriptional regulator/tetratricopeptide (TPR) repeat protein